MKYIYEKKNFGHCFLQHQVTPKILRRILGNHNMPSVNSRQPANIYFESLMPKRPNKSKCVAEQKDLTLSPQSSFASNEGNAFLSKILIWFPAQQRIAGISSLQGYILCTSKGQPNLIDHTDVQSFLKSTSLFGRLFWCSS